MQNFQICVNFDLIEIQSCSFDFSSKMNKYKMVSNKFEIFSLDTILLNYSCINHISVSNMIYIIG